MSSEMAIRRELDESVAWVKELARAPRLFLGFEVALIPRVFTLGRLLVQLFLALREEALSNTLPVRLKAHRRWYTRQEPKARTLNTFFGAVRYLRTYMYSEGRKGQAGRGFHPLDKELGLTSDGFSLHLLSLGCRLAVDMSFEASVKWLRQFLGWAPATETIQHAVLGLGVYTQAFFDQMPRLLLGDGEVLVIMIDQKAVPTATASELRKRRGQRKPNPHPESARHRGRNKRQRLGSKKRRKKGDKSKNGRAATLVVMYTLRVSPDDGLLLGPINKVVYGTFAGKRYAFAWARRQAERRGFGPGSNKLIQFVSDGDEDFRVYLDDYFGQCEEHELICTLDLPHVMEYLWKAGATRYAEGSDALAEWAHQQKVRLLEDRVDLVLADLRGWLATTPKTGPGNKSKRLRLDKAIGYLEKNLDRLDYQYLRESDLEMASGAVEGAVNHVIGLRMDHGGMRWIRERCEALLQLRCIEINGHWDKLIDHVQAELVQSLETTGKATIRRENPAPLPTLERLAS